MEKILIRNAHIKTMAGPELENGCLLICLLYTSDAADEL